MKIKNFRFFLVLIAISLFSFLNGGFAQFSGKVFDLEDKPLTNVSVWVQELKIGTSTNELGEFQLKLEKGEYLIVFQQIGYEKLKMKVNITEIPFSITVRLTPAIYELEAVEFTSNREDPAYEIIRKAIGSKNARKNLKPLHNLYTYTKGIIKILSAPKKLLGQEIGNLGGALDSIGKGILYQSEAESIVEKKGNEYCFEKMISSRVAGNDRGFSFNSASSLDFNLSNNTTNFGKAIVSPIADYALAHYKYKLIGSNLNEDGSAIDKIQLIPRIPTDAVWNGHIYINEKDYSIYEFDGYILGKQCKQEIFDSIFLSQKYVEIPDLGIVSLRNQTFRFNANFFGFKIEGKFLFNFSNFQKTDHLHTQNKSEVLEILEQSNKKSIQYWDSIRPIPLLIEEVRNYRIKDSIRLYFETRAYKDSTDKISNKLNYGSILTGYTFRNSFKRRYLFIDNLLNTIYFNPVQGLQVGSKISYQDYLSVYSRLPKISVDLNIQYGISDETWRSDIKFQYYFDKIRHERISLNIGRKLVEFNPLAETNRFYNQVSSLYYKNNVIKLYSHDFIELQYVFDLNYSSTLHNSILFSKRNELINHSNYSFLLKRKDYLSNNSTNYEDSILQITHRDVVKVSISYTLNPFTKVWKSPEGIQKISSDWPSFQFAPIISFYQNRSNINILSNFRIKYTYEAGRWGVLNTVFEINNSFGIKADIPEAIHPSGNPFGVADIKSNLNFKVLKLYQKIGFKQVAEIHLEHHFEGFILDRVPWVRYLGLKEVSGASALWVDKEIPYFEWSVGIENIGYKGFRFFRLDWVKVMNGSKFGASYLRLGLVNLFQIGN